MAPSSMAISRRSAVTLRAVGCEFVSCGPGIAANGPDFNVPRDCRPSLVIPASHG
jgi:hypothetical protein